MEDHVISARSEKQEDLVRKYCAEAEGMLAEAQDYDSAARLKDSLCRRFQVECESSLVVAAMELHLDSLLKQRWRR